MERGTSGAASSAWCARIDARCGDSTRPTPDAARPSLQSSRCSGNEPASSSALGRRLALEGRVAEHEAVGAGIHLDAAAVLQLAEEHLVGQRALDVVLDEPRHRTGTERLVVAVLGEPA